MKFTAQRLALIVLAIVTFIGVSYYYVNRVEPPKANAQCDTGSGQVCADAPASMPSRDALALLDTVRVAGRAPKTGYTREQFGPAWSDDVSVPGGHNGCGTRDDILQRDLIDVTFKDTKRCVVATGTLNDLYTGKTIKFVRGPKTSDDVQIDHIIALSDAWQKGAQQLSAERRRDLANDPLNLQAVDGPTNQSKSDSDAASWLPPSKGYRCAYLTRQIQVKAAYQLWVTQAEKDAMTRELGTCP
ncbi:HNH endonuclease family protein [Nocardia brasiliensis]|uniref:HNH endonuclease family protein n=1 Tax=Nocardia brasiliensis TaxID=37326 RepID=UPI001895198B|nr:HNH endonuclease family protein [Nocardia brasiliensis]MBF6126359.1 HNH endonuclease [Nocardia brasiliensis]